MSDEKKSRIKVDDLQEPEQELTAGESKDVQGGIMLLPAVQKVREAAARTTTSDTDSSNIIQGNLIGTD